MEYKVAYTGANNILMEELRSELEASACTIASENDSLDYLIYCIDPKECNSTDYDGLLTAYDNTALQLLKEVSAKLPLLEKGNKKRLCFITKSNSSINQTRDTNHWERIISAACNMAIHTLFNRLNPEGYTFRIMALEDYEHREDASYVAEYFLRDRSLEESSPKHSDERRLVMRDKYERELPW